MISKHGREFASMAELRRFESMQRNTQHFERMRACGHLRRWVEDATRDAEGHDRAACSEESCSLCGDALAREQFNKLLETSWRVLGMLNGAKYSQTVLNKQFAALRRSRKEMICWTCQRYNGIQPLDLTECKGAKHTIITRQEAEKWAGIIARGHNV